jgi:CheY-like chemotaxis protein
VRWQRAPIKATEDKPAGIGVAFEFKSDEQRRQIDELVKKLNQEAPEELPEEAPFRVLVAEDNPLVREMLRFGVRKFHRTGPAAGRELEVIEAENGQEAWEHVKEGAADLAIIDYYMPIMNGAQLIRKIRETESLQSLPVIVVSVGGEEARQDSYAAGADLFLDKPVLLGQLFASLRRLLGLQQQAGG